MTTSEAREETQRLAGEKDSSRAARDQGDAGRSLASRLGRRDGARPPASPGVARVVQFLCAGRVWALNGSQEM
jgi:hypothetical protein